MKKIVFLLLLVSCSIRILASDSLAVDSMNMSKVKHNIVNAHIKNATKSMGDNAYAHNNFASAAQIYESIIQTQGEAAEIYYNLGNSYYKLGNISKSILNYERALLLKPGDSDIRFNLEIARSKTVDKIETVPQFFLTAALYSLINSLGANAWAKLGVFFFIVLIGSTYLYFFSKRILIKKISFILSLVLLTFIISCNLFAKHQQNLLLNRFSAIVITPSVTVKSTPNASGTDLFIIHEGRKVSIKDSSMREWKEIRLEDGNVGWVQTSDIEII